jgi:hypothetical protein
MDPNRVEAINGFNRLAVYGDGFDSHRPLHNFLWFLTMRADSFMRGSLHRPIYGALFLIPKRPSPALRKIAEVEGTNRDANESQHVDI